jgi:hypothetical protein
MIDLLEEVAKAATQRGPGMTRLWGNTEWALLDFPGVHDIVEYERRRWRDAAAGTGGVWVP